MGYFCNGLCSIGEDGFGTGRVANLCKLFGRHKSFEEEFQQFRDHSYTTNTEFKDGQSRTQCREATVICRSYGCRATGVVRRVYMSLFCLLAKKNPFYFYVLFLLVGIHRMTIW